VEAIPPLQNTFITPLKYLLDIKSHGKYVFLNLAKNWLRTNTYLYPPLYAARLLLKFGYSLGIERADVFSSLKNDNILYTQYTYTSFIRYNISIEIRLKCVD